MALRSRPSHPPGLRLPSSSEARIAAIFTARSRGFVPDLGRQSTGSGSAICAQAMRRRSSGAAGIFLALLVSYDGVCLMAHGGGLPPRIRVVGRRVRRRLGYCTRCTAWRRRQVMSSCVRSAVCGQGGNGSFACGSEASLLCLFDDACFRMAVAIIRGDGGNSGQKSRQHRAKARLAPCVPVPTTVTHSGATSFLKASSRCYIDGRSPGENLVSIETDGGDIFDVVIFLKASSWGSFHARL